MNILLAAVTDNVNLALTIIFIVIFFATAVITICALPGWIKIPSTYLKVLFTSLLLEVAACIFMLWNQANQKVEEKASHNCEERYWTVLNEKGQISPIHINNERVSTDLDTFSTQAKDYATYTLVSVKDDFLVNNKDGKCLGKVPKNTLINNMEISLDDISYEQITFKRKNGRWSPDKKLSNYWSLRLSVNSVSDVDTAYYNGKVTNYDVGYREIHNFKGSDGAFYSVILTDADFIKNPEDPFVTFAVIRTKIAAKLS